MIEPEINSKVEDLKPLTSLRFVAAMMIVIHHAQGYFSWPFIAGAPATLVHGVSFFFVLSGFILTHVYTSKPFPGYPAFMRARFARLWPVHVFALLVLVIFMRPDSITFDGHGIFNKWVVLGFNLTLTQAIMPFTSYAFSWNAVSWSISTEAFFYLAFPLLLVNIRRTWHWKLLGAALVAGAMILVLKAFSLPPYAGINEISIESATYTNPLIRGFEFCLGMATWVLWDRYIRRARWPSYVWTALELTVLAIIVFWLGKGFLAVHAHIKMVTFTLLFERAGSAWLFAILIAVIAAGRGIVGRILSERPLVVLGEVSFSIYMLHQILLKFFFVWLPRDAVSPLMFFSALLFIASGSYLMIEKPAQRFLMKKRAPTAPVPTPAQL
jgi:peptidoglycan/LPS O-acetylase OafA/YrhL